MEPERLHIQRGTRRPLRSRKDRPAAPPSRSGETAHGHRAVHGIDTAWQIFERKAAIVAGDIEERVWMRPRDRRERTNQIGDVAAVEEQSR